MVDASKGDTSLSEIKIMVPEDLQVAFQRCIWVLVNEKGCSQLDVMEEMVKSFLRQHGC